MNTIVSRDSYRLGYVMSGLSYIRVDTEECYYEKTFNKLVQMLGTMNQHGHTFSMLYNALTEKKMSERIQAIRPHLDFIMSDSGGLQMMLQGIGDTEEDKIGIYRNQAVNSDIAMSFDEIPVDRGASDKIHRTSFTKVFRHDWIEEKARKTARNLRKQIDVFQEMNSPTKPILIMQGNDYDSFMKWGDYILDELPAEYYPLIGGTAIGYSAFGSGELEMITGAFLYSQLPKELKLANHFHLLGIGSAKKMVPYITFLQNGLYAGTYLTYDSTKHSSCSLYGRYYGERGLFAYGYELSKFERVYKDIQKFFGTEYTLEEVFESANSNIIKEKTAGRNLERFIFSKTAVALAAAKNFMNTVDKLSSSKEYNLNYATKHGAAYSPLNSLYEVKSKDDFDVWMREYKPYLKSKRVTCTKANTLDSFF